VAIDLANGRTITALEIQQALLEAVHTHRDMLGPFPPALEQALALWERTLTAIEHDDRDTLARDIDWAIKERVIRRWADRHGVGPDDPRLAQLDVAYHDITPGRGVFRLLEEAGAVSRVVDDAAVQAAMTTPPPTRARLRGAFINAARGAKVDFVVDWMHLRVTRAGRTHGLTLRDPFRSVDERVDEFIAGLDEPLW